jgi:two-component system, NarL family, nitrate/nitrite response regulator NarL
VIRPALPLVQCLRAPARSEFRNGGLIFVESITNPSTRRPVRVVLADDECLFRASLRQLLGVPPDVIRDVYGVDVGPGFEVVGEAGTGEDTVRLVESVRPDLLLLDLSMPRMSGLDALRALHDHRDAIRILLLAGDVGRSDLVTAVNFGVRGALLKDASTETLFEAMTCVMAGQYWLGQVLISHLLEVVRPLLRSSIAFHAPAYAVRLTARERQVLSLVVAGCSNKEIARQCSLSEQTVKHHLTRMFDKVGASNRLELAMVATRQGLDSPVC